MRKLLKIIGKTVKWVLILFFTSSVLMVLIYKFVPVYITPLMVIRCVEQKMDDREMTLHHEWVPLEEISEHLPVAVMASEDQRFLLHSGFDLKAIQEAIDYNNTHPGKVRGASTISQQTAKNVFLWNGRSWVRKGLETYFTFLIELMWSKQRIMEVYLNSIEMGDGIYGAQAVATEHFHKDASQLTREECALISATLPNPLERNSAKPTAYLLKRQKQILHQMKFIPKFPSEGEDYDPNTVSGGVYKK